MFGSVSIISILIKSEFRGFYHSLVEKKDVHAVGN